MTTAITMGRMPRPLKELTKDILKTPAGKFAKKLRALMADQGLTSHDVAARLETGEATVRHWMRGQGFPAVETCMALGRLLKLPDWRDLLPK